MTVPALKVNYFDPQSGRYGETATKAVSFEIAGSAASGAQSAGVQASSADNPFSFVSSPAAASPAAASDPRSTGALMNPNGLAKPWLPSVPWWAFALPGFVPAVALSLASLWRHSLTRRRALERKAWAAHLSPLSATDGRAALEEGRARLQSLLAPGELWRTRLDDGDRWPYLKRQSALWDEAFFSDGRSGEPWAERWAELARVMEAWK
jgi:hypothetical protein